MASPFVAFPAAQVAPPGNDPSAAGDLFAKLLAMLRPDVANPSNVPGTDVAPMSIAQPEMPSAAVPAPLPNTPQAKAMPSGPPVPYSPGATPIPFGFDANDIASPQALAQIAPSSADPNKSLPALAADPKSVAPSPVAPPMQASPPQASAAAPITTGSTAPPIVPPGNSRATLGDFLPQSGADFGREALAFLGGLSNEGGIRSMLQHNASDRSNNATLRALIDKGVDPVQAANLVQSPDLLKSALPQIFQSPQVEKLSIGDTLVSRQPDGSYKNVTPGGGGGLTNGIPIPGNPNLHGDAYAASITDPGAKTLLAHAQAILRGDERMPDTFTNKSPTALQLQQMVYQLDPGFTAAKADERKKALTGLAQAEPNSLGGQITNGKAAVGHLAELADSAAALKNTGGAGASWRNWAGDLVSPGGGETQAAISGFKRNRQTYAGENVKFLTGGSGGEGDRQQNEANFSEYSAPGELASALEASKQQMLEKFQGLQQSVDGSLGGTSMRPTIIDPDTQQKLTRIDSAIAKLRAQQAGIDASGATNPARGAGNSTPQLPPPPPLPQNMTKAQLIDNARQAIANGKDPKAVIGRLQQYGITQQDIQ